MPRESFTTGPEYWTFMDRAREKLDERDMPSTRMLLALNRSSEVVKNTLESQVHKKYGLTWQGFKFLFVLWVTGELEPHRTAGLTYLRRATVSSLANALEERLLITKRPSDSDGRSVILAITGAGAELIENVLREQQDKLSQWASPLTATEQQILVLLLEKLLSGQR
ncbi:MarR family winged helix-turn-helix transcriptional regulator [Corynebacterium glyciniphilum]|uniref:MarR family winged helix-turn-helix transcriptional regulator n=1 Tax=Corynebacterium glyciniphilum TaxID=1404244 RepID=UPI003DA07311